VLVGLPDVTVLGVVDVAGRPVEVVIEQRADRPVCVACGASVRVKERQIGAWARRQRASGSIRAARALLAMRAAASPHDSPVSSPENRTVTLNVSS